MLGEDPWSLEPEDVVTNPCESPHFLAAVISLMGPCLFFAIPSSAPAQGLVPPHDSQALTNLLSGEFRELGRSEGAVTDAFVIMQAINDSGCPPQRTAPDLGVSQSEIMVASIAVPQKYPRVMQTLMVAGRGHRLYAEALALVAAEGCSSARTLTLAKNLIRYMVWLNAEADRGPGREIGPIVSPSAEVGPPSVEELRGSKTFRYGPVPEDFRPPVPDVPPDITVFILMQKQRTGSLVRIATNHNPYNAVLFTPAAEQIERERRRGNPAKDRILSEDLAAIDGAVVLECSYLTTQEGSLKERHYWYKLRPAGADPDRLKARLNNHPLLAIGEARQDCPLQLDQ